MLQTILVIRKPKYIVNLIKEINNTYFVDCKTRLQKEFIKQNPLQQTYEYQKEEKNNGWVIAQ